MEVSVKDIYTSCGCNKTPHAADWASDGLICFGSSNELAIFDPSIITESSRIIQHIPGHKGRINCARWLRSRSCTSLGAIATASSDNSAILWSLSEQNSYSIEAELKGHTSSVTIADGLILGDDSNYQRGRTDVVIATASADSTVKIWTRSDNEVTCSDCISFGTGFALDVRLAVIATSKILACAVDDCRVHLFYCNDETGRFEKVHAIAGHEDWVRCLDFHLADEGRLYLATGSQDSFVRVYKLAVKQKEEVPSRKQRFDTEEWRLRVNGTVVGLQLETVLAGHDNWIYGVSWHGGAGSELQLVTSSMDKTLVVWAARDGVWVEIARVGEVGGNTLGFYGGKFGPDGRSILAHGYQGSFHLWRLQKDDTWLPEVVVGGHCGEVTDMSWSSSGSYLLSCSLDQSTRLHALWRTQATETWYEISRPQVHGHDLSCVACISDTEFVSGAEEIVLRAFTAPTNFIDNFERICGDRISRNTTAAVPEGASVPALGLSNKPVFIEGSDFQKDPDLCFSPITLQRPPTEENLLQNTLWPEVQKLYGHGYEIRCVAARPDGALIASACRASKSEYAAVIFWETKTWTKVQELRWHQLTVLQMAFSPDGRHLVTVSRDRKWCLYTLDGATGQYATAHTGVKTPHTRVIWCCAWITNSSVFATGSRDGNICLWEPSTGNLLCSVKEPSGDSVTALAFSPPVDSGDVFLVAGTDSGAVNVYLWSRSSLTAVFRAVRHGDTVNRLLFRPHHGLQFASCSSDFSVKISELQLSREGDLTFRHMEGVGGESVDGESRALDGLIATGERSSWADGATLCQMVQPFPILVPLPTSVARW